MFKLAKPFFIKTVTPMHAGSGQDLGIVDMPIQRERHTSYPKIEGSSLKGSIREVFRDLINGEITKEKINLAFGPEESGDFAGALGFTDARILLFPVKSMKGVFAWITCPKVLKKFKNDLEICGENNISLSIPNLKTGEYLAPNDSKNVISKNKNVVILEEYTFKRSIESFNFADLKKLIPDSINIDQVVILHDDDFKDFVNLSTEVITRTKIDPKTGTVAQGALFTEEYLPAESVMYSLALATPVFKEKKDGLPLKNENDVMDFFNNIPDTIQIGGNSTIGKGIVEIYKWKSSENGGNNE